MTKGDNPDNHRVEASNVQGIEIKIKFEFYLLALVFTVLALAVQTAKVPTRWCTDALEIFGWFSLLISGISGLLRLEKVPIAYFLSADAKDLNRHYDQLIDGRLDSAWVSESLMGRIEKKQQQIRDVGEKIKSLYGWHKWLFVVGIVSITLARALPAGERISDSWRQSMSESKHVQNPPTATPSRPAAASTPPAAPTKPAEVPTTPPAKVSPPTKQRE